MSDTESITIDESVIVQKTWGSENIFANNELYCGKIIFIRKNEWSSGGKFHYHKEKDEAFFVVDGCLLLELLKNEKSISTILIPETLGSVRIPPNTPHRFKGISDCVFIEVSTHHDNNDSFYVEESKDEDKREEEANNDECL